MLAASDFQKLSSDSAHDFERLVAPMIIDWVGGEIVSIESLAGERSACIFDRHAGVDAVQIKTSEGMRGIASRIQKGFRDDYRSFTVRYQTDRGGFDTEYQKRLRAIKSKGELFFPHWQSQAYVTEFRTGGLIYLCFTKTISIYGFDREHQDKIKTRTHKKSGARFRVYDVSKLREAGYHVHTYENQAAIFSLNQQKGLFG